MMPHFRIINRRFKFFFKLCIEQVGLELFVPVLAHFYGARLRNQREERAGDGEGSVSACGRDTPRAKTRNTVYRSTLALQRGTCSTLLPLPHSRGRTRTRIHSHTHINLHIHIHTHIEGISSIHAPRVHQNGFRCHLHAP